MKLALLVLLITLHFFKVHSQCSIGKVTSKLNTARTERRKNPDKSKAAAKKSLICAEKLKQDKYICESLNILGYHNLMEGNTEEAYKQFRRSLDVSERNGNDMAIAIAQNNLGNYYNYLGLDELALEHYLKSLKKKRKLKLKEGVDVGLVNVGIIYDKQGKHKEAIQFYKEALVIKRQKEDQHGVALVYENLGIAEAESKNYEQALKYFGKAIAVYQSIGLETGVLGVKISQSVLYAESDAFTEAEDLLNEIKPMVFEGKDITRVFMWYKTYGAIELSRKNYTSALAYGDSALVYAERTKDLTAIMELYEFLSKVHKEDGNVLQALSAANTALRLKDSLNSLSSQAAIEELQFRYSTEVLNNKIEIQRKNIELLNVENRNRLFFIVLILLTAGTVISIIFWRYSANMKQKRKLKVELDDRNKELLSFTVQMAKKNEAIQKLKESITMDDGTNKLTNEREIQSLFKEVERTEDNWMEFRMRFEKIDPEFFNALSNQFQLSETDLRICALIKLNVTTQEAAKMLNITPESVNKARYRLRKKMELPKDIELNSFVRKIS
ncbi:MAG: hypothetical protein Crog4KO_29660 [Crocinitomicaceae bacterium]